MMSVNRSRSAEPIGERAHGSAMGTWGLYLGLVVLLMFVAGLAAAALYLETGQPRQAVTGEPVGGWPPHDVDVPRRGLALAAIGLLVLATAALTGSVRRLRAGPVRDSISLVALGGVSLIGAVITLVADLDAAPFRWDEHAYTSTYWVLTGAVTTFIGVGAIIVFSVLVQMLTGVVDDRRHLELTNTVIYVWFTLATSILLLALVHLLPLVGGSP
jgi:heme/copper-type cytochrome/quinol oxidase subunit 3